MIDVKRQKECCGCGACAQACPRKCISMVADREGFLYPRIDRDICIECGICKNACPIGKNEKQADMPVKAYAAYANDEALRAASSSGGIFTLLATWVLEHQGVVFGAAFDDDHSVHHVMIERMEDLPKLQGSKYLQSRIEQTYRQAKEMLDAGQIVLYSGTTCQTAGLRSYLGREYDQLYLVDVICHGVPSPKVWERYLSWQKAAHGDAIRHISFRNKAEGWKAFSLSMDFVGDNRYRRTLSEDPYLQVFLRDVCLRPSCYQCAFKGAPRMADITLGDAWGIQNWMPEMDDDGGTSVVLVHSRRGQALWEAILPCAQAREGDLRTMISGNNAYRKSSGMHPRRQKFFAALEQNADMEILERLSRKTLPQKFLSRGKSIARKMINYLRHT